MNYVKWLRSKVGKEKVFLNFAGACIINDHNQVLLQRRGDRNTWGFPGGTIELGESVSEALLREIKEETGLTIKTDYLIGVYTKYFDEYPNGDKAQTILFFFKCLVEKGDLYIDGDETLDLRYFDLDEIPELVNQQHKDCLADVRSNSKNVVK